MSAAWKGEPDDAQPPFGRKAREWFQRVVTAKLMKTGGGPPLKMYAEEVSSVVQRLCQEPRRFVVWSDDEQFRGRGWSSGHWSVVWDDLLAAAQRELTELRRAEARAVDAVLYPSLEEWLRADLAGELEYAGDRGGTSRLPGRQRERLRAAAIHRATARPRVCIVCGGSYVPDRSNATRCIPCRERMKTILARRAGPGRT